MGGDREKENQLHEEQTAGPRFAQEKEIEQDKDDKASQGEQATEDVDAPLRIFPAPDPVNDKEQEGRDETGRDCILALTD